MAPKGLRCVFKKVLKLSFDEEPPYDEIIEALKEEFKQNSTINADL
jgi:hypothetical protein